jgi:hypothetical protein
MRIATNCGILRTALDVLRESVRHQPDGADVVSSSGRFKVFAFP